MTDDVKPQDNPQDAALAHADRQDIRLAVVLNGGVSLAVWISGVAVELHRLVQASRAPDVDRAGSAYSGLLDVLQATARVDVVAGTSAGGLNGGFLSLGLVHGCDLMAMRDLWADKGDLAKLLRDPRTKDNPSLLRGDYFHSALKTAYRDIADNREGRPAPDGVDEEHVELFLTGTLWRGRTSPFTDGLGRRIVEVDHDAIFRFSSDPEAVHGAGAGDLRDPSSVAPQLAVASRCTSSFPGAFEPFKVGVTAPFGDCWVSDAGLTNFGTSQYVVDGGVLLNKPIRPALDAVYRQPASRQVRRVMAYVVPDPGEDSHETTPTDEPLPKAPEVLLGVLTRLRTTDSVSAELAEIERRNQASRLRRRTRDRVASTLVKAVHDDFVANSYQSYREVRIDSAAVTVGEMLGKRGRSKNWSRRELTSVIQQIAAEPEGLPFVPQRELREALDAKEERWFWGQSEVVRLGDLVVDVLKRAVWLAPMGSADRMAIVEQRGRVHDVIAAIRRNAESLDRFWIEEGGRLPARGTQPAATPAELDALRTHLTQAMTGWEGRDPGQRREVLYEQALRLATCLFEARDALHAIARESSPLDHGGEERDRLADLVSALVEGAGCVEDVLKRMLGLQVVHVAFAGASVDVEQEVELFQVSSEDPDLLTGVQEHHFGAFYRTSWRVNDWMRGRLDGAAQLVQMLLAPDRLRQLGFTPETAYDALRAVAVGPETGTFAKDLGKSWNREAAALREELAVLAGTGPLPRTLPRVARRIAARLHAELLPDELRALGRSVLESERDPLPLSERWAREAQQQLSGTPTLADVLDLADGSEVIGRQRIRAEIPEVTDTFSRTAAHGLATFTSMVQATKPRLVASTVKALRGYAVLVWVLVSSLTTRSNTGRNVVSLAIGVGGALLGLTLVMPGVPIGVTLVGVVLILAAATATTLAQHREYGRLGWRLLVPVLLVLAALVGQVWWTISTTDAADLRETLLGGLAKVGVVLAVVLLGWFVARARPPKSEAAVDAAG